ncbi:protein of unknown function [Siphonobacter aquaeclarae]|uniref:DUF4279 domain-containing protein n=2 Tax=Siphonobacter aquaeclarae TaxID=563176 RepID=A0A1G9HWV1_9BACT|nr:protein of unknown function [Siphonobacter aquaeclarae]
MLRLFSKLYLVLFEMFRRTSRSLIQQMYVPISMLKSYMPCALKHPRKIQKINIFDIYTSRCPAEHPEEPKSFLLMFFMMNKQYPRLKLILSLTGDNLDAQLFNSLIDIPLAKYWSRGDINIDLKSVNSSMLRKENTWSYSTGYLSTFDLDDLTRKFEIDFQDKIEFLRSFIRKFNIDVVVNIVVITGQNTPALCLSNDFLNILVSLKSDLNFDLYFEQESV